MIAAFSGRCFFVKDSDTLMKRYCMNSEIYHAQPHFRVLILTVNTLYSFSTKHLFILACHEFLPFIWIQFLRHWEIRSTFNPGFRSTMGLHCIPWTLCYSFRFGTSISKICRHLIYKNIRSKVKIFFLENLVSWWCEWIKRINVGIFYKLAANF